MRLLSFVAATLISVACASNVIDLSSDNWDEIVGKGKPGLIEFFAPWCGHCKNLAPIYEQLGDAFAHAKDRVYIAKVDADGAGKDLAKKYDVTSYPTLKWFDPAGNPEPYEGGRELDSLAGFVTEMSNVKSNIKPPPPPDYLILDYHTFDDVALDQTKDVLVSFTAPWCGHCKAMKPTYDKVGATFKPESDCIVANIDADDKKNQGIAQRYGVTGFPTLKFFPKGKTEPVDYTGGRSETDFIKFLNENCGTNRAVGGGLNDEAGLVSEFDALASKFFVATADARDSLYKEALTLSTTVGDVSKYYLRVMEKVVNTSEKYLETESKRLESILQKRTLAPAKLDEMKIKANILRSFAEQKKEETEKVDETVRKATAEL